MKSCVIPIWNVAVPTSVKEPPVIVSTMLHGLFTIVSGTILSDIVNLQRPRSYGVLVPGVGGHERPVIKALWRVVMWPAGD